MVIIISGLPGSGKSFFASRLAGRLSAAYISSDTVRKEIDAMGQYTFEDKFKVYEEMAKKAGEALRLGKTVVVDATFYRREMRGLFNTLARLLQVPVCFIEIEAEENVIKERLRKPRKDSEADYAVYLRLRPQYEKLSIDHLTLQSTDDNIEMMLSKADDYIKKLNDRKAS